MDRLDLLRSGVGLLLVTLWMTGCTDSPANVDDTFLDPRLGDPQVGYSALVNEGYVSCGIPYSAYSQVFAPASWTVPGRTGLNKELGFAVTATTTASGVDIVGPNCLSCHAEYLMGELVLFPPLQSRVPDVRTLPTTCSQAPLDFLSDLLTD